MTTLHGIDDLVVALRELGDVLQPVRVAGALRGVRIDARTLEPFMTWRPAATPAIWSRATPPSS